MYLSIVYIQYSCGLAISVVNVYMLIFWSLK